MDDFLGMVEQPEPLRLKVHDMLEELIVGRQLEPGRRLVEADLAQRLGVSRGPVREALQMLAREGWVELRPNYGAYVAKPTYKEIIDYFDIRALLEVEAARLAALSVKYRPVEPQARSLADLEDVVDRSLDYALHHTTDGPRPAEADDEARRFHREGSQRFHIALARLSSNNALVDLLERLSKRTRWYFSPRILERSVLAWQEHIAILAAVKAGDPEGATSVMTAHMEVTRESYLRARED